MRNTTWPDGFPTSGYEYLLLQARTTGDKHPDSIFSGEWVTCRDGGGWSTGVDWTQKFRAHQLVERVERACDNLYNWEFRVLRYSRSCTRRRRHG